MPVWNYSYDDNRSEESQPLVYKGVLYVTTNSATMAIDAKTGKRLWKTKVEYPPETPRIVCCGIINRGAAIYDGKIFRTTLDANVIGLDAKTGKELWRKNAIDFKNGSFIDGWDPQSGEHLWRTYTIPGPGEPGHDTWPGVEEWGRLDLDHRLVRSGAAHHVLGHRQSESVQCHRQAGRQSLHLFSAGARSQDGKDKVALSVLAE